MLTNNFRNIVYLNKKREKDLPRVLTAQLEEGLIAYVQEMLSFNNMAWEGYNEALSLAKLPTGSRGLDAGCGPGGILSLLAKSIAHSGEILGLDYTPEHVNVASKKAIFLNKKYKTLNVEIGTCDFNEIPFRYKNADGNMQDIPDDYFDWIWSSDTICPGIFKNPQKVFKELVRITKKDGKIVLFYANDRTILLPGFQRLEAQLYEMLHFPDTDKNGGLMVQTDMANIWMANCGMEAIEFKTLNVEKHGSVKNQDISKDEELPGVNDQIYIDYQISAMYSSALTDLHNGYKLPYMDKDRQEYLPHQDYYYFRLIPQVNIGVVKK